MVMSLFVTIKPDAEQQATSNEQKSGLE